VELSKRSNRDNHCTRPMINFARWFEVEAFEVVCNHARSRRRLPSR
jgi:hypothetical protein